METRVRVLLVLTGLPAPELPVVITDSEGKFAAGTHLPCPRRAEVSEITQRLRRNWTRISPRRLGIGQPAAVVRATLAGGIRPLRASNKLERIPLVEQETLTYCLTTRAR